MTFSKEAQMLPISKLTTPSSNRIYTEEFQKYIQSQKRFREVWKEFETPWNHELFQYANDDFYFYRFNVNRMERNTPDLIRNILFRLLDLYNINWDKCYSPIAFKCIDPNGSTVGYTFEDFYEDDDIIAICKENKIDKICIIRMWKGEGTDEWVVKENNQYKSHGLPIRTISLSGLFTLFFGEAEYKQLESHLAIFMTEMFDLVGYRSIKFLSSMNLAMQKLVLERKLIEYAKKTMCYTIIDKTKKEVQTYLYADGYSFPNDVASAIQSNFLNTGIYKALLGSAEFAESFVTSEWLFHSLEGTTHFDYTAIISGYLKSIEQLLLQIVKINVGNNCKITLKDSKKDDAIKANITRYTFYKGKFRPIVGNKTFKKEYIDLTVTQTDYMDSDLGTFEYFLRNNPHIFHTHLQKMSANKKTYCSTIADIVSCFRSECRNGYFHTHNLKEWNTVEKIRENALMIYTLLLGGCIIPKVKHIDLKIPCHDWFDSLCINIQSNRRRTLDYIFEYSNGSKVCAVFDFQNNTKEYTDSGIEHYESLRFFVVPDFSLESYEKIDAGLSEECEILLTRSSIPSKIWGVNRKKDQTILYES